MKHIDSTASFLELRCLNFRGIIREQSLLMINSIKASEQLAPLKKETAELEDLGQRKEMEEIELAM